MDRYKVYVVIMLVSIMMTSVDGDIAIKNHRVTQLEDSEIEDGALVGQGNEIGSFMGNASLKSNKYNRAWEDWKHSLAVSGHSLMPKIIASGGRSMYFSTIDTWIKDTTPLVTYALWKMEASKEAILSGTIASRVTAPLPKLRVTKDDDDVGAIEQESQKQTNPAFVMGGLITTDKDLILNYQTPDSPRSLITPVLPISQKLGRLMFLDRQIPSFASLFDSGAYNFDRNLHAQGIRLSHFTRITDDLGVYLRWISLRSASRVELWSVSSDGNYDIATSKLAIIGDATFSLERCRVSTWLMPGGVVRSDLKSTTDASLYISLTQYLKPEKTPVSHPSRFIIWSTSGTTASTKNLSNPTTSIPVDLDSTISHHIKFGASSCFDVLADGNTKISKYFNQNHDIKIPSVSPSLSDRWWGTVGSSLLILCPAFDATNSFWLHDASGGAFHIWKLDIDNTLTRIFPPSGLRINELGVPYLWVPFPYPNANNEDRFHDALRFSRSFAYFSTSSYEAIIRAELQNEADLDINKVPLALWRTDGSAAGTVELLLPSDTPATSLPIANSRICSTDDDKCVPVYNQIIPLASGGVIWRMFSTAPGLYNNRTPWFVASHPTVQMQSSSNSLVRLPHEQKLHQCISIGHRFGGVLPGLWALFTKEVHVEIGDLQLGDSHEFVGLFRANNLSTSFVACRLVNQVPASQPAVPNDADLENEIDGIDGSKSKNKDDYSVDTLILAEKFGPIVLFAIPNGQAPVLLTSEKGHLPSIRRVLQDPTINLQSFMPISRNSIVWFTATGDLYKSDGTLLGTSVISGSIFKNDEDSKPSHYFDSWAGTLYKNSRSSSVLFFLQSCDEERQSNAVALDDIAPLGLPALDKQNIENIKKQDPFGTRMFGRMSHRGCDLWVTEGGKDGTRRLLEGFPCRCLPPLGLSSASSELQSTIISRILDRCPDEVRVPAGLTYDYLFVTDDDPTCVGHSVDASCAVAKSRRGWMHSLWRTDGSREGTAPVVVAPPVCPKEVMFSSKSDGTKKKSVVSWRRIDASVEADTVVRTGGLGKFDGITHYKVYVRKVTPEDPEVPLSHIGGEITSKDAQRYVVSQSVTPSMEAGDAVEAIDDSSFISLDISSFIGNSKSNPVKGLQKIAIKVVAINGGGESVSAVQSTYSDSDVANAGAVESMENNLSVSFFSCPEIIGMTPEVPVEALESAEDDNSDLSKLLKPKSNSKKNTNPSTNINKNSSITDDTLLEVEGGDGGLEELDASVGNPKVSADEKSRVAKRDHEKTLAALAEAEADARRIKEKRERTQKVQEQKQKQVIDQRSEENRNEQETKKKEEMTRNEEIKKRNEIKVSDSEGRIEKEIAKAVETRDRLAAAQRARDAALLLGKDKGLKTKTSWGFLYWLSIAALSILLFFIWRHYQLSISIFIRRFLRSSSSRSGGGRDDDIEMRSDIAYDPFESSSGIRNRGMGGNNNSFVSNDSFSSGSSDFAYPPRVESVTSADDSVAFSFGRRRSASFSDDE